MRDENSLGALEPIPQLRGCDAPLGSWYFIWLAHDDFSSALANDDRAQDI
jgi:hypothetical protein